MKLIKQDDVYGLMQKTCKVKYVSYGSDVQTNYYFYDKENGFEVVFHIPTISKNDFERLNVRGMREDEVRKVFAETIQSFGGDGFEPFNIHCVEPCLVLESAYQMLVENFNELFQETNRGLLNDMLCYANEGIVRSVGMTERASDVLDSAKEWLIKSA